MQGQMQFLNLGLESPKLIPPLTVDKYIWLVTRKFYLMDPTD